jgi:hypothetical protein
MRNHREKELVDGPPARAMTSAARPLYRGRSGEAVDDFSLGPDTAGEFPSRFKKPANLIHLLPWFNA